MKDGRLYFEYEQGIGLLEVVELATREVLSISEPPAYLVRIYS